MTTTTAAEQAVDLTAFPDSAVPAAFDRECLYSPTLALTRYSLGDRYVHDYRPGNLYEPMPKPPSEPEAYAWWCRNIASTPVPDFLGLKVGDQATIQLGSYVASGEVIAAERGGALVRYPLPEGSFMSRTHAEMYVRRRDAAGRWY